MQWLQLWKNVMKPQSGRMWASNKLALNIESSTLSKHFFGQIGVKADGLKVTLNKKPKWKNNFDLLTGEGLGLKCHTFLSWLKF